MAHKKGQGATRNGRDSNAQHRGLKVSGGQLVRPGQIILRQCGTRYRPGHGVGIGNDYTIFALVEGTVQFESRRRVSVFPLTDAPETSS